MHPETRAPAAAVHPKRRLAAGAEICEAVGAWGVLEGGEWVALDAGGVGMKVAAMSQYQKKPPIL